MAPGRFIAGIGALIRDPNTGRYLFLRRAATKDFGAMVWECVTGRVNQGESFEQAVHREVMEEIGLPVSIDFIIATTHFYRGETRPENELLGVMYRCSPLQPPVIYISGEHDQYTWLSYPKAVEKFGAHPDHAWLLRTLDWAETMHQHLPTALVDQFHHRGLNINHPR